MDRYNYADESEKCFKYFDSWTDVDQTRFVFELISQMDVSSVSHINQSLEMLLQRDIITLLAQRDILHVAELIFSYLDEDSLRNAEVVCRDWRLIIKSAPIWKDHIYRKTQTYPLWRMIAERRGWSTYLAQKKYSRTETEINRFSYKNIHAVRNDMAKCNERIMNGECQLHRLSAESQLSGVYCLQYEDNVLVTGHREKTIRVWDLSTLVCNKVLAGHTGSVLCLQFNKRIIISGSSDHTVRVWDFNTGTQLSVLDQHLDSVLHLRLLNDVLVTCSKDKSLIMWDLVWSKPSVFAIRFRLHKHHGAVNMLEVDDQYIVSASGDRTIRIWSMCTGDFMRTLRGHERGISSLHYSNPYIASGSSDNTIRLWTVDGASLRVIHGHSTMVRSLRFNDTFMVSGDYNGDIKIWDFKAILNSLDNTNKPAVTTSESSTDSENFCVRTLHHHTDSVFSIQFDKFQMISSSRDNTIVIWDFLNYGATKDCN